MKTIQLLLISIFISVTTLQAQKIKVVQGNKKEFKEVTRMNVQFDYNGTSVGKFKSEQDYLNKKKEEYNKKESGKGDSWEKSWIADREARFEPKFVELFNKYSKKTKVSRNTEDKYTLIIKTTRTEPGFNVVVHRKNAEVDGEFMIVETADPSKVLLKGTFSKATGQSFGGYDYDTGVRLQEAYAKLGKGLGSFMSK